MTDDKKPNADLCLKALADLVETIGECYCMNSDEAMGRNPCGYCLGKGILEGGEMNGIGKYYRRRGSEEGETVKKESEMTDDKGAGEGQYIHTLAAYYLPCEANCPACAYEAGLNAERARCLDIARQYALCEGIAQAVEKRIGGGQDGNR